MDSDDLKKIALFLEQYKDIYGKHFFVDADRVRQLSNELPDVRVISAPGAAPQPKPQKPSSPEEKPDTPLWNFMREIRNCTRCALGKTRTKFVFGDGNEHADIMFIGEAPGADEDRTGIPFVGRAGKLLNKLLDRIQLKREDVFIANILKCRPPNNRDPLPSEVQECIPYLYKQIDLIQPEIIVALGRVAAQNLLNTTASLKQMRGRLWQYRGVDMIVTYHPAAILRNPGFLNAAYEDFDFIAATYREKLKRRNI